MLESLSEHFNVVICEDSQQAIASVGDGDSTDQFVLASIDGYKPLDRALADVQAKLVLDTIGEGVCVFHHTGECLWSNNRMRDFPPEVYDRVKSTCISACSLFRSQVSPAQEQEQEQRKLRSKKFGFQVGDNLYFESVVSPVCAENGQVEQVVAVVWDASTGRRLQQKIDAIDAAGRELVRIESESLSKMNVAERLGLLEEKIIRFTSDLMHFDHFIIRLLNKRNNKLEPVISVGLPTEALEVDLYAQPEGNGVSGYVAATGRSYICHDIEKDPRYVLGLDHAKSSLTVPLRLHDKVIGVFNIESDHSGAFNEDDRQFSEIFGRYIAVALNILDLLVVERYTTTGRMAENVVREMSAPLNDIVTETEGLIEEYIGNDDMRARLNKIIDHVSSIRNAVKDVTQGPRTILGSEKVKAEVDTGFAGRKIMVSDDEANIRDTIASVLGKLGAEVFSCKDGHEAVNCIETNDLDLIISDIRMPHRNGYEIFAAAQRKNENLPVMLMTGFGYDPSHSIVRASQEGLQAVLFKPFKVEQLMDEVRKALDIPASEGAVEGEGA
ncbi:MAG: response regulator, partial [Planctomycetota bacterium]